MSSTPQGYSSYYQHVALSPGLGRFRRFGAYWSKKLHDETSEVEAYLLTLEDEMKKPKYSALPAKTVLDCPRRIAIDFCPRNVKEYEPLHRAWDEFDKALVRYGESLCMSQQIMKMPTQDKFSAKLMQQWKLPDYQPIFERAEFALTGEEAGTYLGDPAKTDTCVWRAIPHGDFLTNSFLQARPWINRYIHRRKRSETAQEASQLEFDHLVAVMDTLACVVASVLLAVAIVVLVLVRPLRIRLALIGLFGTLFALLLKLMAGNPTRGEVFGATAAFYAVTAIFIGSMSNGCACP